MVAPATSAILEIASDQDMCSALGGIRTPNLLIRRTLERLRDKLFRVPHCS